MHRVTFDLPPDLLATKLHVPQLRPNLVRRDRLLAALDAGLDRPLILLSAPAGFGKTTLVSEWLQLRAAAAEPPLGICWVSLDEGENDPVRFLRYLAAALHRITPRASEMVLALSQASSSPPLPAMLSVLINDIVQLPQASMLVLDDYHVIRERSIHEAIVFLLDHMPPRFHLLIVTREEPPLPLARLRGRNAVVELGQADLRFRADEVTTFLQGWLVLTVSPADVRALEARTEGWITGLQLAALSMQQHPDVAGFLAAFGGSDRHVLDYLVEEVLDRQPRPVQDFLLRTSILDRFCGPLCDAVAGLPDGGENGNGKSHTSLDMLGQLERANLFLVPLDAERHWYRYHQLFADMLRARLRQSRPELLSELHRQASAWLERAELIPEAIDHALAAGDVQRTAVLIEQHGPVLMERGQTRAMVDWLDALPPELVRVHPFLAMIRVFGLAVTGDLERAQEHLRDIENVLEAGLPAEQEQIIRGQLAATHSGIALDLSGDLERAVALSRKALELLRPADRLARAAALCNATAAYLMSGDVGPASEHTVAAAESARAIFWSQH